MSYFSQQPNSWAHLIEKQMAITKENGRIYTVIFATLLLG
jgi:hypothetical protein